MFAHSLDNRPPSEWEPLEHHLAAVGQRAAGFAAAFGCDVLADVIGRLHDIGKASAEFQAYIASSRDTEARGPDHSTAGAREAQRRYPRLGRVMAFAIAGHHAGLADFKSLARRLNQSEYVIKAYNGWERYAGSFPDHEAALAPKTPLKPGHSGFSEAFLIRMLFSCLVDADFLETERFYEQAKGREPVRGGHAKIGDLTARLAAFMASKRKSDTPLNRLRAEILDHACAQAKRAPGFFSLTVPTGGGKTLASLSFALQHANHHALDRVIYVIPYTSIIEQTADVFRDALGTSNDVLEHHVNFDWEAPLKSDDGDDEGRNAVDKLKRASENWDAPVIVTTAVQFYESLFAARTSRCRKLHNIARSVIVLDEAQTLPVGVLKPCLAALDELQRNYGASVVVCTATQPAWRRIDGAIKTNKGELDFAALDIGADRELAPEPSRLYAALRRVSVEFLGVTPDEQIAARFTEQERMLCIVNTRAHARALYDAIAHLPGALHLSTLMCPIDRRHILKDVRERLTRKEPVRLVSTSLIEAGVDVDFPEVWRAEAGLDSIAQAAGRCNREGALEGLGRVVVFASDQEKYTPRQFRVFQQAMRESRRLGFDDALGIDAVRAYFGELYFQKGPDALDETKIEDGPRGVLAALSERASRAEFPFRSLAAAFRLIEDQMETVIVPIDDEAQRLLRVLRRSERPVRDLLRRLQAYVVSIPKPARDEWLRRRVLTPAHPALGDDLLAFADGALYRSATGLNLEDRFARNPGSNIV